MFRFSSARRFRQFLEPAVAGLLLYSCPAAARAAAGTAGATFLDIPVGAEPASLGSAYSALASNAYAPSWNPGGLGFVTAPQAAAQYLSYLQSINYEYASLAYPLRPGKSLGAAVQYLGTGDIAGTEVGGAPTGNFSSYYAAYALAYGQKVTDRLSLGVTGKWINAQISDVSASAFAADFGGLYKIRSDITLAATLDNLGTRLKFLDTGDPLPLAFHAAAAYHPSRRWLASLEAVYPKNGPAGIRAGGQWQPVDMISLRAGYRTDTLKELSPLAGFSTGIGLTLWTQELAYAWVPYGDLGDTHYLSLLLKFGASPQNASMTRPRKNDLSPSEEEPELPRLKEPPPALDRGAPEAAPYRPR